MPVNIHGKSYITVAERVTAMHADLNGGQAWIETGIASEDEDYLTMWAKVVVPRGTFYGHARSSKADKSIEGQSPLEVAETSAVGRALGFAGFGVVEGIASADEVQVAQGRQPSRSLALTGVSPKDKPNKAKFYAWLNEKGLRVADALRLLNVEFDDSQNPMMVLESYVKGMRELKGGSEQDAYGQILEGVGA